MNFLTEQCSKEATMNRGRKTAKTIVLLIGLGFALSACADADTAGYSYGYDYGYGYRPGYVYEAPDYGWLGFSDGGDRDHGFRHDRERGFDDHHAVDSSNAPDWRNRDDRHLPRQPPARDRPRDGFPSQP